MRRSFSKFARTAICGDVDKKKKKKWLSKEEEWQLGILLTIDDAG